MIRRKFNNIPGIRPEVHEKYYFKSKMEANFARYLNFLAKIPILKGGIHSWAYEPDVFIFEAIKLGTRSYKPDFKVYVTPDSEPIYYETKGYLSPICKTKLKRMKKYYPQVKVILIQSKELKAIMKSVGDQVTWE